MAVGSELRHDFIEPDIRRLDRSVEYFKACSAHPHTLALGMRAQCALQESKACVPGQGPRTADIGADRKEMLNLKSISPPPGALDPTTRLAIGGIIRRERSDRASAVMPLTQASENRGLGNAVELMVLRGHVSD